MCGYRLQIGVIDHPGAVGERLVEDREVGQRSSHALAKAESAAASDNAARASSTPASSSPRRRSPRPGGLATRRRPGRNASSQASRCSGSPASSLSAPINTLEGGLRAPGISSTAISVSKATRLGRSAPAGSHGVLSTRIRSPASTSLLGRGQMPSVTGPARDRASHRVVRSRRSAWTAAARAPCSHRRVATTCSGAVPDGAACDGPGEVITAEFGDPGQVDPVLAQVGQRHDHAIEIRRDPGFDELRHEFGLDGGQVGLRYQVPGLAESRPEDRLHDLGPLLPVPRHLREEAAPQRSHRDRRHRRRTGAEVVLVDHDDLGSKSFSLQQTLEVGEGRLRGRGHPVEHHEQWGATGSGPPHHLPWHQVPVARSGADEDHDVGVVDHDLGHGPVTGRGRVDVGGVGESHRLQDRSRPCDASRSRSRR